MAEQVQTGGVMQFDYRGANRGGMQETEKRDIEEAYVVADERKKKQKRNKIIFWVVLIAILLLVVWGIWFFTK